jgi:uncharacterized protein YbjT (DUF2867 family)
MTTAWLAGASGLVGGHLLDELRADAHFSKIVLLGRRPLGVSDTKVEERVVDFGALDGAALPPCGIAFVALGTTIAKAGSQEAFRKVDFDAVVAVARAAKQAGASRIVLVSSLGADPGSRVFYSRIKGEAERAVEAVGLPSTIVLRPSLLDGDRKESRPGERVGLAVLRGLRFLMAGRLRRYRAIHARTVARAMLALAKAPGEGLRVVESEEIALLGA